MKLCWLNFSLIHNAFKGEGYDVGSDDFNSILYTFSTSFVIHIHTLLIC